MFRRNSVWDVFDSTDWNTEEDVELIDAQDSMAAGSQVTSKVIDTYNYGNTDYTGKIGSGTRFQVFVY